MTPGSSVPLLVDFMPGGLVRILVVGLLVAWLFWYRRRSSYEAYESLEINKWLEENVPLEKPTPLQELQRSLLNFCDTSCNVT